MAIKKRVLLQEPARTPANQLVGILFCPAIFSLRREAGASAFISQLLYHIKYIRPCQQLFICFYMIQSRIKELIEYEGNNLTNS
jgi:hypothetical protein